MTAYLPGALFYSTTIPACLWFLAKNKNMEGFRNRKGEVLFIDARKLGSLVDRTRRELNDEDIAQISDTYHAWRGEEHSIERRGEYEDVSGFCYSASLSDIKANSYLLAPGGFVGAEDELDDGVPFEDKFLALKDRLELYFSEGSKLELSIKNNLIGLANDV